MVRHDWDGVAQQDTYTSIDLLLFDRGRGAELQSSTESPDCFAVDAAAKGDRAGRRNQFSHGELDGAILAQLLVRESSKLQGCGDGYDQPLFRLGELDGGFARWTHCGFQRFFDPPGEVLAIGNLREGHRRVRVTLVSFALRSIMTGTAQAKLETFPQGNTPCPRASGRTLAAHSVLTPFQCLALSRSNARGGRSSTHLVEGHTTLTLA